MYALDSNKAMKYFRQYVKHKQAGNRYRAMMYKLILINSK